MMVATAILAACMVPMAQAQSVPARDMRLAYAAWPDLNPACINHVNVTFGTLPPDTLEFAIGLDTTLWRLRSCDLLIDAKQWASTSREERCVTLVHAIGHLALHRHEEGGVMAQNGPQTGARYRPCEKAYRTRRQRIETVLARRGWVSCDRWHGHVLPCTLTTGRKVARIRASIVTDRVVIHGRVAARDAS